MIRLISFGSMALMFGLLLLQGFVHGWNSRVDLSSGIGLAILITAGLSILWTLYLMRKAAVRS